MELDFILKLAGIAATLIAGANFVIITVAKTFWSLTFKSKAESDEKRFNKIEEELVKLRTITNKDREENDAFRHKYKATVESLFELIKVKFEDFDKNFNRFESSVKMQIELAISKNNEKK